jgi:hypothetical protein
LALNAIRSQKRAITGRRLISFTRRFLASQSTTAPTDPQSDQLGRFCDVAPRVQPITQIGELVISTGEGFRLLL